MASVSVRFDRMEIPGTIGSAPACAVYRVALDGAELEVRQPCQIGAASNDRWNWDGDVESPTVTPAMGVWVYSEAQRVLGCWTLQRGQIVAEKSNRVRVR